MADKPLVSTHVHQTNDGPVEVELVWCAGDDGVHSQSLTVRSHQPLTAMTLKALPLGAILEEGRWSASEQLRTIENDRVWESWVADASQHQRRRQYGDDHYELVARLYRELRKGSDKPTTLLAEQFDVDVATARRWIASARQRGLIEPL